MEDISKFLVEDAYIIVPVLWFLGWSIKKTKIFTDNYIPWILMAIGVTLTGFLLGFNTQSFMQGILTAAVAVFGHQLYKQTSEL